MEVDKSVLKCNEPHTHTHTQTHTHTHAFLRKTTRNDTSREHSTHLFRLDRPVCWSFIPDLLALFWRNQRLQTHSETSHASVRHGKKSTAQLLKSHFPLLLVPKTLAIVWKTSGSFQSTATEVCEMTNYKKYIYFRKISPINNISII